MMQYQILIDMILRTPIEQKRTLHLNVAYPEWKARLISSVHDRSNDSLVIFFMKMPFFLPVCNIFLPDRDILLDLFKNP